MDKIMYVYLGNINTAGKDATGDVYFPGKLEINEDIISKIPIVQSPADKLSAMVAEYQRTIVTAFNKRFDDTATVFYPGIFSPRNLIHLQRDTAKTFTIPFVAWYYPNNKTYCEVLEVTDYDKLGSLKPDNLEDLHVISNGFLTKLFVFGIRLPKTNDCYLCIFAPITNKFLNDCEVSKIIYSSIETLAATKATDTK